MERVKSKARAIALIALFAAPPFRIGMIRNEKLFHEGGCEMQLPADWKLQNDKFIFISDFDNQAFINIDGKDIVLRLDEKKDQPLAQLRKGQREKHVYRGEGIEVVADYVVTWICPKDDDSCEVTRYDGKITVTRGSATQVVNVQGQCGT